MLLKIPAKQELERRRTEAAHHAALHDIEGSIVRCLTLAGFIREAWHILEPETHLVWGWHIDAICLHLEAVSRGEIGKLLINIPPGMMKSLIVSVFWPAWEWTTRPSLTYLATSYKDELTTRDTRKTRDLILSEWYQARWPQTRLTRAAETSFANGARGSRESMAFKNLTGGRGERVIIDDPHSTETAESEAERATAARIFRESVPSRINDPKTSAIVVIMQRLHEMDVSGVIAKLKLPYVHLMLPMEFEAHRRCETPYFRDPRTFEGELLFPERFAPDWIGEQKKIGQYAWAGQYQQRPVPREGGMFKGSWFSIVSAAPGGTRWVRGWDLAASEGTGAAFTVGLKLGKGPDNVFYIDDVRRERMEGMGVRRLIVTTAEQDGLDCEISLPKDPAQAGKVQAADYVAMLAGFKVSAEPQTGSKETRAEPFAAQAEAGNVKLVRGPWNEAFLDEAATFPNGAYKDQIDAAANAMARLITRKTFAFASV